MAERPKIIVLTPVKNEAWILPRFLATTSVWADKIIIADQNSTDESAEICKRFEKVVLIRNESPIYDEAQRQLLLIKTARELVPGPRILFALDADEILAANATMTEEWRQMLSARPGTVFKFEKPELYPKPTQCIRAGVPQPLAFYDDDSEHKPNPIHSTRIPGNEKSQEIISREIIILHYAYTRPRAVRAKVRLYSVVENTLNRPVRHRLLRYRRGNELLSHGSVLQTPPEWLAGWEKRGIDMTTVDDSQIQWQDLEVLSYFSKYGAERFWPDDIWDVDWEQMRQQALASGRQDMPKTSIIPPPFSVKLKRFLIRSSGSVIRGIREFVHGALQKSSLNLGRTLQKITFRLHQFLMVGFICFPICWWNKLRGMRIGRGTRCSRFQVTWPHQVQIGARCRFEPDIYFKFDGIWCPGPSIIIGDDVFLGRGCEFNIRKKIIIGRGCAIASGCKFVDHDHGITGKKLDETSGPEATIAIGEYVWLGCNVVILKGVNIGPGAVIGAGAVVTRNVPSGEIWGGIPARKISSRAEHSQIKNILPG